MADDQETQSLTLHADIIDIDGDPVNVLLTLEYPWGKGFTAAQLVQLLGLEPERMRPIWMELIHRQDEQCLTQLFGNELKNI
jgi:hypothetical protein